jgi:hypothetical protein
MKAGRLNGVTEEPQAIPPGLTTVKQGAGDQPLLRMGSERSCHDICPGIRSSEQPGDIRAELITNR